MADGKGGDEVSYTTAAIQPDPSVRSSTAEELGLEGKPVSAEEVPRWKFRVRCCICGELIEEFVETPKGRVPTGHLHPDGLQCEGCYRKAEAHKAE